MKREFFLQTKRIGFSIWNPKDQELANILWSNPHVAKYICANGIFNQEEIEERLQLEIENYAQYHIQYWPIFHLESQEFMGCCGLRNLNEGLELGVHLRPEFWQQGYATEATKAMIDYAFSTLKTQVLYVGHHPQNSASRHLVNKLGFHSIGEKFYPPTGLYHPAYEIRKMRVYVASAFSKNKAGGNKAGVVFQSDYLSTEQKMKIAEELGYSETAFVSHSDCADIKLSYYTPTNEVPLCGHATIATFSVLHTLSKLEKENYTIETKAGILHIHIAKDGLILMEQNKPIFYEILNKKEVEPSLAQNYLVQPLPIQIVSTGLKDILLPMDFNQMKSLQPNFEEMSKLSQEKNVIGVHAFALNDSDISAICRNFAPLYGINEESATGTSNCALACYLYKYHQKKSEYIFEQGYNLNQVSRIIVHLDIQNEQIERVFVGGQGYLVDTKIIEV